MPSGKPRTIADLFVKEQDGTRPATVADLLEALYEAQVLRVEATVTGFKREDTTWRYVTLPQATFEIKIPMGVWEGTYAER